MIWVMELIGADWS